MKKHDLPEWVDKDVDPQILIRQAIGYIVWIDSSNEVDWQTSPLFDEQTKDDGRWTDINIVAAKIAEINSSIPTYFSALIVRRINSLLAEALVAALEKEGELAKNESSNAYAAFLRYTSQESRKLSLQIGLLFSALFIILFFIIFVFTQYRPEQLLAIKMGVLGGIGAYFSMLTKRSDQVISEIPMRSTLVWETIFRMLGGTLSGIIAHICIQAGIVSIKQLFQSNSEWAAYLVAIASGFSERLIPGIIQSKANVITKS